ncbi:hypothetical protein DFH28DRAFT_1098569 [Melampsora americana]|nr:hypothetical protein DFH28DRAFT_1098569 [Melampsora americana]
MSTKKASSSNQSICKAIASYKKKPGTLSLTKTNLTWVPKDGPGSMITVERSRLQSLFSSKDGGTKVMLRICARPIAIAENQETTIPDEIYNFSFTSPNSIDDREEFKREISQVIAQNRASKDFTQEPIKQVEPINQVNEPNNNLTNESSVSIDKGKSVDPLQDWRLKKRVLQNDLELRQLHKEMVIGGQISEGEFWDGREELLFHEARLDSQKKGRSAQMVDPRPETTENGDITISVTPQLIHDIFEQYPVVQKVYNENVPPLNDQLFWTRYFRSKLFNRHRSSARQPGDSVKEDEIFDKYLGDDDDGIEPKNLNVKEVYKLLDLAATEEDHGETGNSNDWTMRAGTQRSSLPLMRRFNEHSQRLLNSSLGKVPGRRTGGVIDGGDAGSRNYYDDTTLSDLNVDKETDRIILDIQGQERYFQGHSSIDESSNSMKKRKRTIEEEKENVEEILKRVSQDWKMKLGRFDDHQDEINDATNEMMENITTRYEQRNGFLEGGIPASLMSQVISTHSTTHEFLRHYWSSILPNPIQTTNTTTEIANKKVLNPEEKAMKAQRMIGFLERTNERVSHLIEEARSLSVDKKLIFQALESTIRAVEKAKRHYREMLGL